VVTFALWLIVFFAAGDAASTFLYHVPQHIWGKLHLRTHHDNTRSYWDHAIISKNPAILLDGFLGAVPYLAIAALLTRFGPAATWAAVTGLVLGQMHVMWRHTCAPRMRAVSCCRKTTTGITATRTWNSAICSASTTRRRGRC
jgi:hypothetical protein